MSEKPALYVVEKKEVVILVMLFVLVTVLSFTMGVRYGESVGKKAAQLQAAAGEEHGGEAAEHTGGTLGAAGSEHEEAEEHGHGGHEAAGHGKDSKEGAEHGKEAATGHGEKESAKAAPAAKPSESNAPGREAADKNSDEFLLNALKEAGVEPPGGKAPRNAELPSDVKKVKSGSYVIQVGSHPTKAEAESQIRSLGQKKIEASVLSPFKDRQGEWHRVVIGSFKTKRDAERDANQLKAKGAILSYFVWRLP